MLAAAGIHFDWMDYFTRSDVVAYEGYDGTVYLIIPYSSNGLTTERVENFELFSAKESLKGEKCIVYYNDIEVGTQMVRYN